VSRFVRFQGVEPSVRGIHVGVFGLVNVLGRAGRLSEVHEAYRVRMNRWFDHAYTDPSTVDARVYDREVNPQAVAWFKVPAADHLVEATRGHLDILDAHDVVWERVESDDPGRVVYEDQHQVVVVPHHTDVDRR
jgi:hypothetical protein